MPDLLTGFCLLIFIFRLFVFCDEIEISAVYKSCQCNQLLKIAPTLLDFNDDPFIRLSEMTYFNKGPILLESYLFQPSNDLNERRLKKLRGFFSNKLNQVGTEIFLKDCGQAVDSKD